MAKTSKSKTFNSGDNLGDALAFVNDQIKVGSDESTVAGKYIITVYEDDGQPVVKKVKEGAE